MNIALEPTVAELSSLIHRGLLGADNVNLVDDLRGVLCRNERPNKDTELLTALESVPYGVEIIGRRSIEKNIDAPTFREQLEHFVTSLNCNHACIADGVCLECGESFKQDS